MNSYTKREEQRCHGDSDRESGSRTSNKKEKLVCLCKSFY